MLFAVAYMYTCTRDHTCSRYYSKSRLFRLRANIGCPTFLVYKQLLCYHVNVYIYSHPRKKTPYKHINFTLSCFIAHTNRSYRKIKIKKNRLVRFELTLYLLYAIVLHLNRYTTANDTVQSLLTSEITFQII